jgi:apolipoprotein N-acyltransferase
LTKTEASAADRDMRLKISFRDLGLACLSAVLLLLSLPGFDLAALAWVGLVPLLLALEGKSPGRAFFLSYAAGLVFFVGLFYWVLLVPDYNLLDEALLANYLAQYVSLWGLGLNWIRKRTGLSLALVAPPLWVASEYVRSSLSFLSLPWIFLGHSQYSHPALIQIASFTGAYGLSFLVVLVNAAIVEAIAHVRQGRAARATPAGLLRFLPVSLMVAGFLLIANVVYGLSVLSRGLGGERLTIALIQGNIPQDQKWDRKYRQAILDRYSGFTRLAAERAPELIVWPETAVPGDILHDRDLQRRVGQVAIEAGTHLLVGGAEDTKFDRGRRAASKYYNAMFLLSPDGGVLEQYRKIRLVPFAEYTPLENFITWPTAIASAVGDYLPGDRHTLFTLGQATFGVVICWEIIFPDLFRQFVKRGADFMINATNEARFGDTGAPNQLLAGSLSPGRPIPGSRR